LIISGIKLQQNNQEKKIKGKKGSLICNLCSW